MKIKWLSFLCVVGIMAGRLDAAMQNHALKQRIPYFRDGIKSYIQRTGYFPFHVEVISDTDGLKVESRKNGKPFIKVREGECYVIRVYNPLPVRVGVNLSVDGLNTISGQPSGISDGSKWVIPAYSWITISGWQVNQSESRRFYFTNKGGSYAAWRGEVLGKDLARNCGVIGAAFFWSRRELDQYYESQPIVMNTSPSPFWNRGFSKNKADGSALGKRVPLAPEQAGAELYESEPMAKHDERAGTGMGERQAHPTTLVAFDYDSGMYKASQAVVLYYDFEKEAEPNPFPNVTYAPEKPY